MKAALRAGVRPSVFVFREQPDKPWTNLDRAFVVALQTIEDERCPECGQPTWLCRSTSNDLQFKVEKSVCYATKALKADEDTRLSRDQRAKAADKKEWGVLRYPVPFMDSGKPLPSRMEYLGLVRENTDSKDEVN